MDLSDAWVVAVGRSGLSGDERTSRYPAVFTRKSLAREIHLIKCPGVGTDIYIEVYKQWLRDRVELLNLGYRLISHASRTMC